jgi:hypothetical protein
MTPNQLAVLYLGALEMADVEQILGLFAADGVVHSPLYGPTPAATYYPELFRDTSGSDLTLRGVSSGASVDGGGLVMIWFHYDWQFAGGERVRFDVVDVLELNAEGRIAHLHIVYDTVDTRPAMEQETGRASWRLAGAEK